MSNKRIAIIGSGASGLSAIKCCLEEGLTPVCLERTDHVGGLWYYTHRVSDGQSCVMKSTVINTSKEFMAYSDFLIPDAFPIFMHNTKVQEYLEMYGEHFDSKKYTQFNTEVLKVREAENFAENGQWQVEIKDHKDGTTKTEVYDGVMVCTGHHADKHIPKFEGLDKFKGKIVHTHDYRDHVGYEGKNVVVIGIGNSGGDVAVELARVAKQVYLSTRRGTWVINRIDRNGYPADMVSVRRVTDTVRNILPRGFINTVLEGRLNSRFDHSAYGLKPDHRFDAQHPMVNDDLPNRIASGTIVIKPDIERFTENGVQFKDGSAVSDIDTVILGTGFVFGFPFMDHPALKVEKNEVKFYKYAFPPDISPPTLAVIGCIQPVGAIMPISEMQCRVAARVFSGAAFLPTKKEMLENIACKREEMRSRYVNSQRHTIQVEYIQIMDELAELIGCKPDLRQLFWSDPALALSCYLGSFCPYQYRLMGPGRWEGARNAIMTIWDRTLTSTKSYRTQPVQKSRALLVAMLAVVVFVVAMLIRLLL